MLGALVIGSILLVLLGLGHRRLVFGLAAAAVLIPSGWAIALRTRSDAEMRERRGRRLAALDRVRTWLAEPTPSAPAAQAGARRSAAVSSPERTVRFGLSLFTNGARDRLLLALTSGGRVCFARAALGENDRELLSAAAATAQVYMLADDEAAFDAVGPDGEPFELDIVDLLWLTAQLGAAQPEAAARILLSSSRDTGVELDGAELSVGRKVFDLRSPLEWKPLLFQEGIGGPGAGARGSAEKGDDIMAGGIVVYQATSIRQLGTEAVIVATLPSLPIGRPPPIPPLNQEPPELERSLRRDLRLMQATADDPPARELRTPVERVFMLPLRVALDRAPRASRSDVSSPAAASP